MASSHFLKRRWKLILNIVTLLALGGLIYAIRDELVQTFSNLLRVNAWLLLLLIPIQLINYHAQTKMYLHLFAIVGNRFSYKNMYKIALELNFVNHVFPSGGVTGISYFGLRIRKAGRISASRATLVQMMKLVLVFLSVEVLVVVGLFMLAVVGRVNVLLLTLAVTITTLAVVITLIMTYVIGSKRRIDAAFTLVTKGLNRVIQLVRPRHPETINISSARQAVLEFHDNYQLLSSNRRALRAPFWYAFLANLTEISAVYVVYLAFDQIVNFGAVIMAYTVANFAGLVSVLPGGVGVYEALMTATMASAGVAAAVSLPVVVMYRVLNTLIQVPPGYFFYHRALQRGEAVKERELPDAA